jgi:hypothetical protein
MKSKNPYEPLHLTEVVNQPHMIRTVGLNLLDFFETEIERQNMAKSLGTKKYSMLGCILAREEEGIT